MATTASSSLLLNPKALSFSLHNVKSISVSLSSSYPLQKLSISISPLFSSSPLKLSSRFVRNVAVFDQEEETFSDGDGEVATPNFSPDLKLFVGNLPFTVDSAQLASLFNTAGNVEMVEVIYDKVTGRSRGFGFVTMSSIEEVEAVAQQFNGYELEGRSLRVNAGPPPPQREESSFGSPRSSFGGGGGGGGGFRNDSNRLYVGNLSWGVDDMSLETLFSEQGKVLEARVVYDRETGRSRGFGFVTYSSSGEMEKAIESLNGADLDGRSIRVSVAEAKPPRRSF
jgi:nucleolin